MPAPPPQVLTVAEALLYLEEPSDASGELAAAIDRLHQALVDLCGDRFTKVARTDYCDGGGPALELSAPPVDLTATFKVTDRFGTLLDAGDYEIDAVAGLVLSAAEGVPDDEWWEEGTRRFKVEYTGGFSTIPGPVKDAALALLADRWKNKVPNDASGTRGGVSFARIDGWPNVVEQLLAQYLRTEL